MDFSGNVRKLDRQTLAKPLTDKQQAEAAKFALDQHSLVSVADLDGTITYVNEKFITVSGYAEHELLGKKHSILNSGLQPKSYWLQMHQQVLTGKVWHDEVRNRAKDGSYYWVDTTIVPNYNSERQVVGFTSIRTDITQQKENIEQLALAKQQAEAAKFALDQHSLVSVADLNGNITYVNDKFIKVSGYAAEELLGRKHSILNSGLQQKDYWQEMHQHVLSGQVWHDEVRNRAKDGSYYWVDTTIVPNYNSQMQIVGFTSIRTDITQQKENMEQLAIAKRQAEAAKFALDQHSLVSMTDLNGHITYVNGKFTEVSGYSESELLGKKHNILNSGQKPKSYWQEMHQRVMSGEIWRDEVRNRAKDGSYYWVDTVIVPNYDSEKQLSGFTSIRTDITQQKENIEQLAIAKQQAELANRAKEDFLANMSHEIRTPMNGIYASLQLLRQAEMSFENRELVNNSLFSSECLLTIINDILDFSKIEAGKLEFENVEFSIRNIVESVISDLLPLADEKGISFNYSYEDGLWDLWLGDPVRMKQILLNLASNAVKFTEKGSIDVFVSPSSQGGICSGLNIKVKDTGIGMSPETVDSVFKRFSQADSSTTRKYGGTGLGMAITLSLIDMMGGTIAVHSELGIGTEFDISIDLGKSDSKKAQKNKSESHDVQCPELSGRTLLVAEDNPINRIIINKALLPTNVNLIEAENGQEAVELALKYQPELIFMDMQMPIMDGITAFRALKEKQFSSPIIAFTANVLEHDIEKYKSEGFDGCISKPVNIGELYNLLIDKFNR